MRQQRAYQSLTQPYVNKLTYCVQRALQCIRHMMLTSADAHPLSPHHFLGRIPPPPLLINLSIYDHGTRLRVSRYIVYKVHAFKDINLFSVYVDIWFASSCSCKGYLRWGLNDRKGEELK